MIVPAQEGPKINPVTTAPAGPAAKPLMASPHATPEIVQ